MAIATKNLHLAAKAMKPFSWTAKPGLSEHMPEAIGKQCGI
jgi:hypothetical protein